MKVSVFLFGRIRVRTGDETIDAFPTQRAALILARLARAPGKRILRDSLALNLWPDDDLESARVRFRQELARLKRALGPASSILLADRTFVGLDSDLVRVDVDDFLQLAKAESMAATSRERFERRRRATDLASAPFCDAIRDSWVMGQRKELDELRQSFESATDELDLGQVLGREFDIRYLTELISSRLRVGEQFVHLVAPSGFGKSLVATEVVRRLRPLEAIILENPTPDVVRAKLFDHPGTPLICTGVTPLHISGEHLVRLHPLPFPRQECFRNRKVDPMAFPSVRLYLSAAQSSGIPMEISDEMMLGIVSLVERLEGWPLPIALAGRRAAVYPATDLAERGPEILPILSDRRPVEPPRHRSFASALTWNLSAMPAEVQQYASRLSRLPSPFSAKVVESEWSTEGIEALEQFLDFGFAERSPSGGFRLLGPLSDFATLGGIAP